MRERGREGEGDGMGNASDDEYMARRKGWDERAGDGCQQAKIKAGGCFPEDVKEA